MDETRLVQPVCIDCGYSLLGLGESGVCPECGKSVEASLTMARIARAARSRSGYAALIASTTATLLLVVAAVAAGAGLATPGAQPLVACVAPIVLFAHLCFVAGAGSWLANDDTRVRQGHLERAVGVLAVVVLMGSLVLPVVGAFASSPRGGTFAWVTSAIAITWSVLYLSLHGLIGVLLGRFASRLHETVLAHWFCAGALAEFAAIVSLLLFVLLAASLPMVTPRSSFAPAIGWGMALAAWTGLIAHGTAQVVLFVSGILLRVRTKRARMGG